MEQDQISEIIQLISESPELTYAGEFHILLMTELNLLDKFVNPLKINMINLTVRQLSPAEVLQQILQSWIERSGNAANLQNLISCFENVGFIEIPTVLTEHYNIRNAQGVMEKYLDKQVKQSTLQEYKGGGRRFRGCKYSKVSTGIFADDLQLLESDQSLKISYNRKKICCEILRNLTRRSICKYVSLLILVQVCIALSLHAQLRSLTNRISVYTWDEVLADLECPNITVGSYVEYQMKMNQLSENMCSVHIFIDLKTRKDWQVGVPLKDPEKISQLKIKGDISLGLLESILQESKQLKQLILTNSKNGLCETTANVNNSYVPQVVNLRNLEHISLENVTSCSSLYEFISENAHMKSLQSFQITGGVVDQTNVEFIRDILQSQSQNLRTLDFPETKWKSLLFVNIPVFPYVENIRLDFSSYNNNSLSFMSSRFPEMFPNLKIFQSKKGIMPWISFQRLLKCRRLTKVVATVNVPLHYSNPIKMSLLNQASPSLEQIEITFYFPNKKYTDQCNFEGIESERKRFSLLLVKANCKIRHV